MAAPDFTSWPAQTNLLRQTVLQMIHAAQSGHPGGSLSCLEILYTLFAPGGIMHHDPTGQNPARDRFVLSKGHAAPALYAVMAATGYDITPEELMTLRQLGSRLQGHPDRNRLPAVEASTGSLGQGASIALGLALAYQMDHKKGRIYCLVGDGESQEGQIWEMAMAAAHHKATQLTVIVDYNHGQIDGRPQDICNLEPLKQKWESFGWFTQEVNGHNFNELYDALAKPSSTQPSCVIAHTIKGKGVSFMENNMDWHGKAPNTEQLQKALQELKNA